MGSVSEEEYRKQHDRHKRVSEVQCGKVKLQCVKGELGKREAELSSTVAELQGKELQLQGKESELGEARRILGDTEADVAKQVCGSYCLGAYRDSKFVLPRFGSVIHTAQAASSPASWRIQPDLPYHRLPSPKILLVQRSQSIRAGETKQTDGFLEGSF